MCLGKLHENMISFNRYDCTICPTSTRTLFYIFERWGQMIINNGQPIVITRNKAKTSIVLVDLRQATNLAKLIYG